MSVQSNLMDHKPVGAEGCSSLYVGDLSINVTEENLKQLFGQYGELISVRILRHNTGTKVLSYAYVNFSNSESASNAMCKLNYDILNGKSMRIMWSHRDPSFRKSGIGNVFIKNLDKSVDQKTLYTTFSHFGAISSCKVVTNEVGASKGYAFVHFFDVNDAKVAINRLDGTIITDDSKPVHLSEFVPRSKRTGRIFNNLYIKNIPNMWETDDVNKEFSKFGKIISSSVFVNKNMDLKKFGFVCFEQPEDAQKALKEMHDREITYTLNENTETIRMYVAVALKKSERARQLAVQKEARLSKLRNKTKGVNLYIKHLDDNIDDNKLKHHFSVFGEITSAKVMRHENGISKGFAFVCFADENSATSALTNMKGSNIFGKPLYISLAQKKDERKRDLVLRARTSFGRNNFIGTYPKNNYYQGHNMMMNYPNMYNQIRMPNETTNWPYHFMQRNPMYPMKNPNENYMNNVQFPIKNMGRNVNMQPHYIPKNYGNCEKFKFIR
ncbi:Polyadenylate tail-binding protein [Intoshia linei]|uniref:Polyadenylate tail-binding protein n=1 Tax=Intoshia linei TaxID=1819745 RepID=A0A177AZ37_9BILA|nr:Polyadenylate tail-binding protein [Intoshia linei]